MRGGDRLSGRPSPPPEDEVSNLRTPPHSVEAEQAILGGLMLDNVAWDHVGDLLTESDFYRHEHRVIYGAIGVLIACNKPADVITVFEHLRKHNIEQDAGGMQYLNALSQGVPSAANARRYAEIVREMSILRRMISASDDIATRAFNPKGRNTADLLNEAQGRFFAIGEEGARLQDGFVSVDQLVVGLLDEIQEMADGGGREVTGLTTGFERLDKMTCGLQAGDLIVLAARPSMGKTAFALNIAEHVAVVLGLPVFVFSMEMGAAALARRMIGSLGRIETRRLRRGTLDDFDWPRLTDSIEKLRNTSIDIDETPALSLGDIRSRARRQARVVGKVGLIVIDYLQLMSGEGGSDENRSTTLGEISRGLKALAKELGCPIIALSQLNRSVETRNDKRPMMSDLRESGAIEQDADVIMFIYRDEYYNKDSPDAGIAEIIIGKQRDGPTGVIKLVFLQPMTKFDNLAEGYTPPPPPPKPAKKAL